MNQAPIRSASPDNPSASCVSGSSPFGSTRSRIEFDHAIVAPDGHVRSPLTHWESTLGVILISPAMGAHPRAPQFVQYLADTTDASRTRSAAAGVQRLIYVLDGELRIDSQDIGRDCFAYFPANSNHDIRGVGPGRLLVFEKPYVHHPGTAMPSLLIGAAGELPAEPFLGNPRARLTTLLPINPSFDMAVNVFTYDPGATLPFVETHVMEHGLYVRDGQGVYRLGERWYCVQAGDSIWMAAYCPQWFVAMGDQPATYIYYKDIHRDPLIR